MRILQKLQFTIAMLCSITIIFYTTLWFCAKVTIVVFPSIPNNLSTILAYTYIVLSLALTIKYGRNFGKFINYKIFRSPF